MYHIKIPKKVDLSTELNKQSATRPLNKTQLVVHWINDRNEQCKKIIGQNRCFCTHSFEQHEIINTNKPYCIVAGCKCQCYQYVPFSDIRCMCRHSYKYHHQQSKMCQMCEKCLGFSTNWSCKCGLRYNQHETVMKFNTRNNSRSKSNPRQNNSSILSKSKYSYNDQSQDNESIINSSRIDQFKQENDKYKIQVESHLMNEKKKQQEKQKIIERINKKYSHANLEEYYEKQNKSMRLEPPENVHETTALELFLKPHNYRYIEIDRLLEKEYSKYNNELMEISNLKMRTPRKF